MLIYLSYTKEDKRHASELRKVLTPALKSLGVTLWSMEDVIPGTEWQKVAGAHLKIASLFIPLVSVDWMVDTWCEAEMRAARMGCKRIIPILLRPTHLEGLDLARLPLLPKNGKPISGQDRDTVWLEVQRELIRIIREVQ